MSAFLSVTYGNFASFLVTLPLRSEKDVMWFLTRELELEAVQLSPQGAPSPDARAELPRHSRPWAWPMQAAGPQPQSWQRLPYAV